MKLSELIASYGDDKVQFQNLDQSIININMKHGASKITFGTEQNVNLDGPDKLGLIVWMDRDRVKEIIAASRPSEAPQWAVSAQPSEPTMRSELSEARERIARIIDPDAFKGWATVCWPPKSARQHEAFAKADRIAAILKLSVAQSEKDI